MDLQGTIRAYQTITSKWTFEKPTSFPEDFAQKRYLKKMEYPSKADEDNRVQKTWETFIETDRSLPVIILPRGEWYKARALLQSVVAGDWRSSRVDFPKGSSLIPSKGVNSIEARLCVSPWTVTLDCFDDFCRLVYRHKALKRACDRRYDKWFFKQNFGISMKESYRILWRRLHHKKNAPFEVFRWKMSRVVRIVKGSRFTTVPKNNATRRPINIEPLGNLFVQRQIGNFLRSCLRRYNIDLDTLADDHRLRIRDKVATIDLKNASDSISMDLVRFLLPKGLCASVEAARSPLLYGHDKMYHYPNKVSSMGNGFTFELMTLILTCLCKVLDSRASVFGDDIIISQKCAPRLIPLLEGVGFKVNQDKSFIEGPFRESCGANYHDDFGYIKSYDFLFPESIVDCATILSKAYLLREYPSFRKLYYQLLRRTPKALLGGPVLERDVARLSFDQTSVPLRFACDEHLINPKRDKLCRLFEKDYQLKKVFVVSEFRWLPDERTCSTREMLPKRHWAKYEMYLAASKVSKDVITGAGQWKRVKVYYTPGGILRAEETNRAQRVKGVDRNTLD